MVVLTASGAVIGCAPERRVGPAGSASWVTVPGGDGFARGVSEYQLGGETSARRLAVKTERLDRHSQGAEPGKPHEQWRNALSLEGGLQLALGSTVEFKSHVVDSLRALDQGPHVRLGGGLDLRQTTVAETEVRLRLADNRIRVSSTQGLSQFDESDEGGASESGSALAQAVEADLIRSGDWRVSTFLRHSRVDDAFEDDGLPDQGRELRGRNRQTVSLGGTFGWGPVGLTLERESNERVRDGDGYQEDNIRTMLTLGLEDLSQRIGLGSWPALAPDAIWVSMAPGEVDPGGTATTPDRVLDQGFGLSWAGTGTYADLSFWRYVYDGRQPDAEDADWIGHGAILALGAYGAGWNVDGSVGFDRARNEEPYSRSRDLNLYGSLAVAHRPEQLPDLRFTLTLGRYRTDYIAYDGEVLTDYGEVGAAADFSKFFVSDGTAEGPSLVLFYWFRGLTTANSFADGQAEGEHLFGLVYKVRF